MSVEVQNFLQTLITTVTVGSLYALLALGYTMVYGILKFINFAHSDVFVLGAWTSFTVSVAILTRLEGGFWATPPVWLGVVVAISAIAVCSTVGLLIERLAYKPLRRAPRLNVLITAIGVSLLLQNAGQIPGMTVAESSGRTVATVPFGPSPKSMPTLLPDRVINNTTVASGTLAGGSALGMVRLDREITIREGRSYRLITERTTDAGEKREERLTLIADPGTYEAGRELQTQPRRNPAEIDGAGYKLVRLPLVPIRLLDVLITLSAVVMMIGLQLLVFRTKIGTAMRAISHNIETASLMGINANFVISFTFVLGSALAAAAGFLFVQRYPGLNQTAAATWLLLGLTAFVAAVVGGIGNVRGAVLGGFLIAAIEFFGSLYLWPELKDVYVFGVLILVLLVRPSGILGSTVREKV